MKVKGNSNLKLDFCDAHKKDIPENMVKYVQLVYSFSGINLSDSEAKNILKRKKVF